MCELNFASYSTKYQTSQVAQVIKNPPANAREVGSISGWRRYPGCPRKWQPTLIFLPAKSHGQRTLVGYCPWNSCRVTHDWAHVHTHTHTHIHTHKTLYCTLQCFQFSSVAQSCPTLCDPMDCTTPGLPVH